MALVHDPELVILDEPQAGLDPQGRILVRDYIRQLARKKTILLTTHDMEEADRLSDRVAIIDRGRILVMDTPSGLKEKSGFGDVLQIRLNDLQGEKVDKFFGMIPVKAEKKTIADGLVLVENTDVIGLIPEVNSLLKRNGLSAKDMTVRKRTLEDVFIAMTGRGLRE